MEENLAEGSSSERAYDGLSDAFDTFLVRTVETVRAAIDTVLEGLNADDLDTARATFGALLMDLQDLRVAAERHLPPDFER